MTERKSSPPRRHAALGARCRRFESCLPDASKSQSPADISTAPQGAVFYWFHSGVRKTCVKPADGNPFCARLSRTPSDAYTHQLTSQLTESRFSVPPTRGDVDLLLSVNSCLENSCQGPFIRCGRKDPWSRKSQGCSSSRRPQVDAPT